MSKIGVIGAGFSGLSAACYLAMAGHEVHVFEKNASAGGRARVLRASEGFVFDMGPSWYWMPDVFESFFQDFGHRPEDFYTLHKLDPGFEVVFEKEETLKIPYNYEQLSSLFESVETGSAGKLDSFMREAEFKYHTGIGELVYKPGLSLLEFADMKLLKGMLRLQVFTSFSSHVRKYFDNPKLLALMEFPVLFLGAMPQETPALYSLMNYAGLKLGTWYPQGGFGKVVDAFVQIAESRGVHFHYNAPVEKINSSRDRVESLKINGEDIAFDGVIASSDYHHTETELLGSEIRNYPGSYWERKTFAPSCLIFYLGINKRISKLNHHTLFFEEDLYKHSLEIYKDPRWPEKPLFYTCCPSRTDATVAPEGHENLFLLMPIAPGLGDTGEMREKYFRIMLSRLESFSGESILPHIVYKKSYCVNDFISDYNSYKGNAYGLANTLMQTAILKPKIRNRKVRNLLYSGQLTVPGPGVPPAIISGKIAAGLLNQTLNRQV